MKAIYIRVSTEEQNPENQLKDCLSIAGNESKVFEEQLSAFKDKERPVFKYIEDEIKRGKITELYCWDWDRLFRNRKKLVVIF